MKSPAEPTQLRCFERWKSVGRCWQSGYFIIVRDEKRKQLKLLRIVGVSIYKYGSLQ